MAFFIYFLSYSDTESIESQYEFNLTCGPPPIFMVSISIINIILYVVDLSTKTPLITPKLIYNPCKRNEAWRFFTYAFVHTE